MFGIKGDSPFNSPVSGMKWVVWRRSDLRDGRATLPFLLAIAEASVPDQSQLLAAFGNNNEIAGSLVVDWEGSGEAAEFKNSGKLNLALEKGRYANLQALRAKIDL